MPERTLAEGFVENISLLSQATAIHQVVLELLMEDAETRLATDPARLARVQRLRGLLAQLTVLFEAAVRQQQQSAQQAVQRQESVPTTKPGPTTGERRYFRGPAEPAEGPILECIAYMEYDGELNTRSVWVCGDEYFSSSDEQKAEDRLGGPLLSDEPLSRLDVSDEPEVQEISQAEFEEIWLRANQRP